jgi:hypothetical protein
MNTIVEKIKPDEFILSVLSPEERLDAAFEIAKEAFKKSDLTLEDIENAITILRRKNY